MVGEVVARVGACYRYGVCELFEDVDDVLVSCRLQTMEGRDEAMGAVRFGGPKRTVRPWPPLLMVSMSIASNRSMLLLGARPIGALAAAPLITNCY